jgi:DNA mismatch repair protein MutS
MYEKYIETWKRFKHQYGDQTCLFYMVGKFYEMYDILDKKTGEGQTNVKQAVETLGITLTTREGDGPSGENCYFAGFPEQSLQKFAGLLTREGWTVVVCDQEKNASGKVTDRPVARIFSPGTHIELAGAEAPYLAGIWFQETAESAPGFAACVLDLTTGHLASFESKCQGNGEIWSCDELVHFFQIHTPREVVVWWRGSMISRPSEALLRRRCGFYKASLHLESGSSETQGVMEQAIVRKQYLEKLFSKKLCLLPILEQLHLRTKPLTERVLVALLLFAEEHLPSAVQNLHEHVTWAPSLSVYMGNNTLTQLNYIATGAEQSVLHLFQKTLTSLGKRAMRERLLTPSSDLNCIQTHLDEVEYCYKLPEESIKKAEGSLRLIHDIARIHRKILMYNVSASDILALDTSYGCALLLDALFQETILDLGEKRRKKVLEYKGIFESLFDIEKAKLALKQEDLYFFPQEKAPKTCQLETQIGEIKEKVATLAESIRIWAGLPPDVLRIESQETSSYVLTATKTTLSIIKKKLQTTSADQHPCPNITVHEKKSSRGSLEFPLLDTYHYQTLRLRNELSQAVKEEMIPICQAAQHEAWSILEGWIAHIDVSLTLAKVAKERGYVKPDILESEEGGGLLAYGLRHPLLETVQTRVEYVKHDVNLGFEKEIGWLLYGMNASGKSSLMKSIGVNVLLAQSGSFVPATVFKLKPFKSILTRILNQDSLWAGLSSFAVEVSELRDIFQKADKQSLVLGDELCSGTESVSATSLVAAGIQYLHQKRSRFVFATHLHDLNKLPEISALPHLGVWHLRVHYDAAADKLIYDRTLHRGPGGTLYGLEVARAMHLPFDILKQAIRYRKVLLGETSYEEADKSSWNSLVIRKECEICSCAIVRDLEVHHIKPRAEAVKGKFQDGTSMNDLRNLIVVCQACHDKHHAGELEIAPQVQTSSGPQRIAQESRVVAKKVKVKWTEEELETIEEYLRKNVHVPIARIVYELKQKEEIVISAAALIKIKNSLT